MSDQVIEEQPNPLALEIHQALEDHCIHQASGNTCEVIASRIMPHIFHSLIPSLIRGWADAWDEVANADLHVVEGAQDDPDGIEDPESFEAHIARHIADDLEGLIVIPNDLEDWEPRFDDHPLPPLPDGGL